MTPPPPSLRVTHAIETLHRVMVEIGWEPIPDPPRTAYVVTFGSFHLPVSSAFAAILPEEWFVFYVNFGLAVAADRRDEVARYATRANWNSLGVTIDLDFQDGHLRAKTAIDFSDSDLPESMIRNAILAVMTAVEKHSGALLDVALREHSAAAAYARLIH